ncbi:hypothetical protein CLU79DRAFT_834287 [Phycomyces nitens]|nr:hypothetical protein CLU79DRAFT_834287 [Phycomyces nitens]
MTTTTDPLPASSVMAPSFTQAISPPSPLVQFPTPGTSSLMASAVGEEVSTLFIVGFPDDMQEREFQNMFIFSPGFEAATLKVPAKDMEEDINYQAKKQTIGFAKFRTRSEALEARDVLNGRKVDAEKGSLLKAEMAKKNLHTKRGLSNELQVILPLTPKRFLPSSQTAFEAFYSVPINGGVAVVSTSTAAPAAAVSGAGAGAGTSASTGSGAGASSGTGAGTGGDEMDLFTPSPLQAVFPDSFASRAPALDNSVEELYGPIPASSSARLSSHLYPHRYSRHVLEEHGSKSTPLQTDRASFRPPLPDTPNRFVIKPPRFNLGNIADQNPPCNTLYVGNLPANTDEEELKAMFANCAGYKRLSFRNKPQGPMCFVEFEQVVYATNALQTLHGNTLSNSVKGGIRLSYSKNPLGVRQQGQMSPTAIVQPRPSLPFDPQLASHLANSHA